MAVVAALRVAPVKGLATVSRDRIRIDSCGVTEDRRVFLLDEHGSVMTLRSHPHLVQVVPALDLDRGIIRVSLPDGTAASSCVHDVAEEARATLFGKERAGRVLRGDVADALSSAAGERVRVVVADHAGMGWDDGAVSLLGRPSAAAVGTPAGDTARYRMLVEIEGTHPFEEDTWIGREIALGDARVKVTNQLGRCVVITQSPTSGNKDWDGLRALAEQRGRNLLCLGVIADVVAPGEVRVGAEVRVAGTTTGT
ncbi:MAG: MOSC domain-containing protein [Nitriliruptorales bacterium]|nr:MOSC domain-containing protein [Nitriliruptorales bacterium]